MLSVWNDSYIDVSDVHSIVDEEKGRQRDADRVLIINTRSYESEIVEHLHESDVDKQKFFYNILDDNDDLRKEGVPNFDVAQVTNLRLSADQTVDDWVELARIIESNYHRYVGFVVQNGTDSMVFTASALSFMLEHLGKPVVFTGSLIPGDRVYTDMKRNTIVALLFASSMKLCEVCILFDEYLYRANRCIKTSRSNLSPYHSPHYPPLATMRGGTMRLHQPLLQSYPHGRLRIMPAMRTKILTVKLVPSTPQKVLMYMVQHTRSKAVVLMAFGTGNGPSADGYMTNIIAAAQQRDILVVVCTQNRYGGVQMHDYEAGRQLLEAGAISADDMTWETVIVKLKYLFGLGLPSKTVGQLLSQDIRGEIASQNSSKL